MEKGNSREIVLIIVFSFLTSISKTSKCFIYLPQAGLLFLLPYKELLNIWKGSSWHGSESVPLSLAWLHTVPGIYQQIKSTTWNIPNASAQNKNDQLK